MQLAQIKKMMLALQAAALMACIADNLVQVRCSALREGYSEGNLTVWEGIRTACLVSGMSAWTLSIVLVLWAFESGIFADAEEKISYSLFALLATPCSFLAIQMWMPITLDRLAA